MSMEKLDMSIVSEHPATALLRLTQVATADVALMEATLATKLQLPSPDRISVMETDSGEGGSGLFEVISPSAAAIRAGCNIHNSKTGRESQAGSRNKDRQQTETDMQADTGKDRDRDMQ